MSQYLFPDAAVEKSSENCKNKTAQSNTCGKAAQDKNSDYVCFPTTYHYLLHTTYTLRQFDWGTSQLMSKVSVRSGFSRVKGTCFE